MKNTSSKWFGEKLPIFNNDKERKEYMIEVLDHIDNKTDATGEVAIRHHIIESLTPPTADEVCEALEEHLEVSVFYDKESCSFYTTTYFEGTKWAQTIIEYFNNGYIQIHGILPPKFVTLIGRFYEGLEE